jgi:hypothetical protein
MIADQRVQEVAGVDAPLAARGHRSQIWVAEVLLKLWPWPGKNHFIFR